MGLAHHLHRSLPFRFMTSLGVACILLCIVALAWIGNEEKTGDNFPLGIFVNNFALPLFGILPLFWGLIHEETAFKKLLSSSLFMILGESSYVFYLIHIGIFQLALASLGLSIFANLFLLYILAILGYYFFELPVKLYLRRRF
jgi:peptidoglycan/LPS O-acetylase OafA/YrhL